MQLAALRALATALRKTEESLCYLYQEHSVSLPINVCSSTYIRTAT